MTIPFLTRIKNLDTRQKQAFFLFLIIILGFSLTMIIASRSKKTIQYRSKAQETPSLQCNLDFEVLEEPTLTPTPTTQASATPIPTNTITVTPSSPPTPTNTLAPIPTPPTCQEIGNTANGGPITAASDPYNYLLCFNSGDTGIGNHSGCGSGDRINVCYTNIVSSLNVARDCIGNTPYCRYYHSENCAALGKVCVPPTSASTTCSCVAPTPTTSL